MTETTATPSIKGAAFKGVAEDYVELVRQGRITPEDQAKYLQDEDHSHIDDIVPAIGWIPMQTYRRVMELIARAEGATDARSYFIERGRKAAERLTSGIHQQYAARPGSWGRRAGEMLIGLAGMIYNFTRWDFRALGDDEYVVIVSEARDFPDVALFTAHGFLEYVAESANRGPVRVTSRRMGADRIEYFLRGAEDA